MPKRFASGLALEVHAEFNALRLQKDFDTRFSKAQHMLDTSIIRDTDPFVPMDTGMLARSAETASAIGKGEIVYDTPYARRLYYGDFSFRTVHHPNACREWFEAAKAVHEKRWIAEVGRILKGGNGR